MTVQVNTGKDDSMGKASTIMGIVQSFGGKGNAASSSAQDAMKRRKKKKDDEFSKSSNPSQITGTN